MFLSTLENAIVEFISYTSTMDTLTVTDTRFIFVQAVKTFCLTALPMLLICCTVAVVVTSFQTRLLFSTESMKPKLNRISPLNGFKKMFSLRSIVELTKSLLKIAILATIIYQTFIKEIMALPRMMDMTVAQSMVYTGNVILSIAQTAAIVMAFVAAADYLYQWWDYEKQLKMSKEELKEEYKQTEGDPQVKSKQRERMQQASRRRMMQNVPNADVVIRNPTHFAVAIKYDPEEHVAPVVVAKGADSLALRIIEVAEANDVLVTENRPLARGLYEAVEVDQVIPEKYYQPVAEVLAFVYSLKKKELK